MLPPLSDLEKPDDSTFGLPAGSEDITPNLPSQQLGLGQSSALPGRRGWLWHWDGARSQPCLPPAALGLWPHAPFHSRIERAVPGTSSGPPLPFYCCSFVWQGEMISLQIGAVGGCENAGTRLSEHLGTWPLPAAASWVARMVLELWSGPFCRERDPFVLPLPVPQREPGTRSGALCMHCVLHGWTLSETGSAGCGEGEQEAEIKPNQLQASVLLGKPGGKKKQYTKNQGRELRNGGRKGVE